MEAAHILSSGVGIKPACKALKVSRAGFYRAQTLKATVKRQLLFPVDDNYNSLNYTIKNQLTSFNLRFLAVLMR
jgi:hypothetical protein